MSLDAFIAKAEEKDRAPRDGSAFAAQEHPIPTEDKLMILANMALGIHALHRQDVMHMDVNAANVLVRVCFAAALTSAPCHVHYSNPACHVPCTKPNVTMLSLQCSDHWTYSPLFTYVLTRDGKSMVYYHGDTVPSSGPRRVV